MSGLEILPTIKESFPKAEVSGVPGSERIVIGRDEIKPLLRFLKDKLGYNYLMFLTAIDRPADNLINIICCLCSGDNRRRLTVAAGLTRSAPETDTVSDLFPTADWHERETAEMFGIKFIGHPDPRNLLLWEGFAGFPLRKDFKDDFLIPLPTGKKEE